MRYNNILIIIALFSCSINLFANDQPANIINKNTKIKVVLDTPLSSNKNKRGDSFTTYLKEDLIINQKTVLKRNTEIKGLVKRVDKFEKPGDSAGLFLLFDQLVINKNKIIPISAILDTKEDKTAIKIPDKKTKDIAIVGGSAIVGAILGKQVLGKDGAKKGLLVGAITGTGAVLLSDNSEINLPAGTELTIKFTENIVLD